MPSTNEISAPVCRRDIARPLPGPNPNHISHRHTHCNYQLLSSTNQHVQHVQTAPARKITNRHPSAPRPPPTASPRQTSGLSGCSSEWARYGAAAGDAAAAAGVSRGWLRPVADFACRFPCPSCPNVAGSGILTRIGLLIRRRSRKCLWRIGRRASSGPLVAACSRRIALAAVALAADAAPRARPSAPNAIKLRAVFTVSGSSYSNSANAAFARVPTSPDCSLATVR